MPVYEESKASLAVEPETGPPPRLGFALLVIAAAQLMLVLDNTITNVALPSIQRALGMATADLNWVITAYALAFGGLLLAGGRAGDLFGRRRVFRIGLVLFTVASLLGGFAWSGTVLIAARVLQGVGAAIAAPTALSLLATTFPAGPARNKALGVYGAMGGLGSVVGLLLGGALTQYVSWRWVLFVNVPIAVLVLLGTSVLPRGERERGRADLSGAATATAGLAALVYAINHAALHGWRDTVTLGFLIAAAVLLIAFVLVQRSAAAPMLPGRILSDRARTGAYVTMFLVGGGMFALFYFLTLYMQVVKGYSPMRTGLAYLPFTVGIAVAAGGVGPQLLSRLTARALTVGGLVLAAIGMVWFGALSPTSNALTALLPAQLVAGFGLGLTFVATTVVAINGVAPQDTGIASGVVNTSQQIGGALGLALLSGVATAVTADQPSGTALPDALTSGYVDGLLLGGAVFLVAAIVAATTMNARVVASH
ncbi:MFS transporter [Micromonospora zamorensis]|uniref:MFS transporter n=2 Tax=Micromonospora zamorensis TaxID=709883 RepID=UPI0033B0F45B